MKKKSDPSRAAHESAVLKPEINRRSFLQLSLGAMAALAGLELGTAGILFLRARSLEGRYGGMVTVGPIDQFQPGSVVEFIEGNFFLVRADDGGFLAISRRCPHLGCTVNWADDKEKFYCPCHASSFDAFGEFQNQMVSRSLDTFPVSFKDGQVRVDTAIAQTRDHFDPAQIAYANQEN